MDKNLIEKLLEIAAHLFVGGVIVVSVLTGKNSTHAGAISQITADVFSVSFNYLESLAPALWRASTLPSLSVLARSIGQR